MEILVRLICYLFCADIMFWACCDGNNDDMHGYCKLFCRLYANFCYCSNVYTCYIRNQNIYKKA